MAVRGLTAEEVRSELPGLLVEGRNDLELDSPEVLAQLVRRVASFRCPMTERELITGVLEGLEGLLGKDRLVELKGVLRTEHGDGLIEDLICCGDLMDVTPVGEQGRSTGKQLYLGAPAFLRRDNGDCLMIGIRSEGRHLLAGLEDREDRIEYTGHARWFRAIDGESPAPILESLGLRELDEHEWLKRPPEVTFDELVGKYNERLDKEKQLTGGQIEGLTLFDSGRPSGKYRSRWREPTRRDTGKYVARRPQAFSAAGWCYVAVESGQVRLAIDLPLLDPWAHGWDEAWRLLAAIDKKHGHPPVVRATYQDSGEYLLKISTPPPVWAKRRLALVGRVIPPETGWPSWCLGQDDVEQEIEFLEKMMFCNVERG
mgnify:CR=1 FL=1|jgi:hypothetical protein